ncbi:hypothetical protein AYO21_02636 [Fonsecaea monophora]|uniref:Cyanovirin-N domain-containing protein n=1 Tax=Fonsecaea monophora TaxID=254056 RepID=A0A177FFR3_9EURO|nr:hypothetical protein AYO21_02636 [Fonsecaea monophora]OAG43017.1 hypothetical protein AYO21_02636 [Fonsecaea monophora]
MRLPLPPFPLLSAALLLLLSPLTTAFDGIGCMTMTEDVNCGRGECQLGEHYIRLGVTTIYGNPLDNCECPQLLGICSAINPEWHGTCTCDQGDRTIHIQGFPIRVSDSNIDCWSCTDKFDDSARDVHLICRGQPGVTKSNVGCP